MFLIRAHPFFYILLTLNTVHFIDKPTVRKRYSSIEVLLETGDPCFPLTDIDVIADILSRDGIAAQDKQTLHHVAELTDISRPVLLLQH